MSWNPGIIADILGREPTKLGRVGSEPINAIITAVRDNQPAIDILPPSFSSVTNTNDTAQTLRASAGRLYWMRVVNTSAAAINVVLSDGGNTIIVGGCVVPAQIAASGNIAAIPGVAEVSFFAGAHGVGQIITTDLRVRAFTLSDGTTGAAAGVTVTVLTSA